VITVDAKGPYAPIGTAARALFSFESHLRHESMSALCVLHLPVQVQAVSSGTLAQKATILICICEARGLFTGRVTDYT
jgi:hypothetical protein